MVVSIGLDHQEYLGATLEAIAREKAGIFRAGRPAVLGSREHARRRSRSGARAMGAPLKRLGIEYNYSPSTGAAAGAIAARAGTCRSLPAPALVGDIQYANAATALAALEELARASDDLGDGGRAQGSRRRSSRRASR